MRSIINRRIAASTALTAVLLIIAGGGREMFCQDAVGIVQIDVHVTDFLRRPVTGLSAGEFKVTLDKTKAPVDELVEIDDPISILFVIDDSGSMQTDPKYGNIQRFWVERLRRFVREGNPDNQYAVIVFGRDAELALDWTRNDPAQILAGLSGIESVRPRARSRLYDALRKGVEMMPAAGHSRRAIVIMSDGDEAGSETSFRDLRRIAGPAGAAFYSINVNQAFDSPEDRSRLIQRKFNYDVEDNIEDLARDTGGLCYYPRSVSQVLESFEILSFSLRHQYRLRLKGQQAMKNRVRIELATENPYLKKMSLNLSKRVDIVELKR